MTIILSKDAHDGAKFAAFLFSLKISPDGEVTLKVKSRVLFD